MLEASRETTPGAPPYGALLHGAPLRYELRRSDRARHARLVVSARDGLLVVVPRRFDLARVPELVAAKADWIAQTAERLGTDLARAPAPPGLPERIVLRSLAETWAVRRSGVPAARARVTSDGSALVLGRRPGDPPGDEVLLAALRSWLARRARVALEPWLRELARVEGLTVGRVSIRAQRTRWASCSATGDVSLNRALLFLPAELVGHVLHHELAHRVELNHSPRFRARLLAMDPDTPAREAALAGAWRHVPGWAR